jgi:hypothetical protein
MAADVLTFNELWAWYNAMDEKGKASVVAQLSAGLHNRPAENVQTMLEFAPYEVVIPLWTAWAQGFDFRLLQSPVDVAKLMSNCLDEIQVVIAQEWLKRNGERGTKALRGLSRAEIAKVNSLSLYREAVAVWTAAIKK